ncbi:MAG: hypothetical protein LQ337_008404 [Flavoplaca oasis]|nr:MAG: hypothetical protein LQ337_008404 [Flavoplaca oasis]
MPSGLENLPPELLQLIWDRLGAADTSSLRLVSKRIKELSDRHFSVVNFKTVRSNLNQRSLQRLVEIANSIYHANNVKCLYLEDKAGGILGRNTDWDRLPLGPVTNRSAAAETLQYLLVHKLVNCRSFVIKRSHDYTMTDEVGDPIEYEYNYDGLSTGDTTNLLLTIIAETGLKVKSLAIFKWFYKSSNRVGGPICTAKLSLDLFRQPQFRIPWTDLHELILEYEITHGQHDWILNLISCASNLQILSLGFEEESDIFLKRLACATSEPPLRKLTLASATLSGQLILDLLNNFKGSLVDLRLRYVGLHEDSSWNSILAFLAEKPLQLRRLSLFCLVCGSGGAWNGNLIHFPALRKLSKVDSMIVTNVHEKHIYRREGQRDNVMRLKYLGCKEAVVGVSYKGSEMKMALETLAKAAELGA